jgi:rRNA maturation endonuclease Nob1
MTKTACKKKEFKDKANPKYECKRCGARVKKKEKVCKPKKMKS